MTSHSLLPDYQSAYRVGYSTETALVKVHNDVIRNIDKNMTIMVLLDLSAAFDTVDHNILLNVLAGKFGVKSVALDWFKSYLHDRTANVVINTAHSHINDLKFGVPQGSCAGPVLYTMYASTLTSIIKQHLPSCMGYADDHALYLAFNSTTNSQLDATSEMEECINNIKLWMIENRLKMNASKTEIIVFGSCYQLKKLNFNNITIDNSSTNVSPKVTYLGVILDEHLNFNLQINKKCQVAFHKIYTIRKIRKHLTFESCHTLLISLVISHLDYANCLYSGLPKRTVTKLQRIQNAAIKVLYRKPKYTHVTPLLREAHWLPVVFRIKFKLLILIFNAIRETGPLYIRDLFETKTGLYQTRSVSNCDLVVPRVRTKLGERAISYSGPKLWNDIPVDIRSSNDIDSFKKKLKTFFFQQCFGI